MIEKLNKDASKDRTQQFFELKAKVSELIIEVNKLKAQLEK